MAPPNDNNLAHSDRQQLLNRLKTQTVHIPNLCTLIENWPDRTNVHFERLTEVVDQRLESLISDSKKLAKLKKANFALFASTWWPYADFEELCTVVYLAIWLFLWDDEIDESTGTLNNDFEAAQAYRKDTIRFVEYSLGLGHHGDDFQNLHPFISSFADIGRPLSAKYTIEQRQIFLTEILFFVEMCEQEQQVRLSGCIPSASDYWKFRLGTSATGVCSAAIEYTHQMQLPGDLMQDPDMKMVWKEQNMVVSISNDILSLKKELALGCVDSLIPISCNSGMTVQEAIDDAIVALETSIAQFDAAAARVVLKWSSTDTPGNEARDHIDQSSSHIPYQSNTPAMFLDGQDPEIQVATSSIVGNIERFIDGCRYICTGNIHWSLTTDRYGLGNQPRDANGGIKLIL